MPTSPPVTNGLSVWLCSDTNVDTRSGGMVVSWGAADGSGLQAAAIGSTRPQWLENQINGYPVLRFAGAQGLFLETGVIAQDSFTLVVVGRSIDERQYGGEGLSGQKMLFYQDGSAALTHAAVSVGWNGVGVYEFGVSEAPRAEVNDVGADCLCPLVVRYENKALKVWLGGGLVIDDANTPSQPVNAPHGIGGTGDATGGFAGDIAEVLIYDRALSDGERQQVEQYVLDKYACGSSSSSASSEMSSWSSEQSSWQSSEQSSEQSSSQESSWSSQESSWSSEWSSEQSSEQSSMEPSSSCSPVLPPDPVPVTSGLVAWQRADMNVSLDGNNQITNWGGADGCLPNAQRVTNAGPGWQAASFGIQPAVVFSGVEGLLLERAGELGGNDFTLVVAACSDQMTGLGSLFAPDSGQTGAVAAVAASMGQAQLSEPGGSGGVRLSAETPGCLCPLTIIYENKQARMYWLGSLVAQDSSTPPYDVWLPKLIGGTGSSGFVGRMAEMLFYNRALGDAERQQVETYLQDRYQCLPSYSSEMSSGQSSEQSSEESSSEESSSSSSSSSSSESSDDNNSSSSSESSGGTTNCEPVGGLIKIVDSPVQYIRHQDPPLQTHQVLGVTLPPGGTLVPVRVANTPTFKIEEGSHYVGIVCIPSAFTWPLEVYVAVTAAIRYDPYDPERWAPITENTKEDIEAHELAHVKVYKDIAININNFYFEKVRLLRSGQHTSEAGAINAITQMEKALSNDCIRWFKDVKTHFNDYYHDLEDMDLNQTPSPIIVDVPVKEWRCRITDWYEHFNLDEKIDAISPASLGSDAGTVFQPVTIPSPI